MPPAEVVSVGGGVGAAAGVEGGGGERWPGEERFEEAGLSGA
jgi:hypothetical protein